jgi:hypothetical protein
LLFDAKDLSSGANGILLCVTSVLVAIAPQLFIVTKGNAFPPGATRNDFDLPVFFFRIG